MGWGRRMRFRLIKQENGKVTVHTPVAGGPYEIALTDGKKVI